ncbi:hypothetical protein ACLMJK_004801 [Lecanora helva]
MVTATTRQYQAVEKGGPFTFASIPKPAPGPHEVSIRLKAVALNPLDWKKLYFGFMIENWPTVLGIDGAGVVENVGEGVTSLKAGDEVFSLFGHESRSASFQEVAVVPEFFVAKKPKSWTFEEAASLPICYCTAGAAIYSALNIPLPFLAEGATTGAQPKSVLVLGGSSGVGAAAIQILRLALPSAVILATSSPKHHAHLISLGATKGFDQKSSSLIHDIKSATPNAKGVDVIVDTVAAGASMKEIYDTLSEDGPREVGEVMAQPPAAVPEGVKRTMAFGRQLFERPGGKSAMSTLAAMIEEDKYKLPIRVENVGSSFEAIPKGLERLKGGVSGTKLVVTVQ